MMLIEVQRAAQEQFDKQSARYGKTHILADITDVQHALTFVPPVKAGFRALDVATGAGHTALHLATQGYQVTASDISSRMLEQVALAAEERGVTIDRQQHAAEALPYPQASFDLLTSRVAPHHFSDQAAFVRESARVLKKGGYFILIDGTVPNDDPEAEEWLHEVESHRDPSHHRLLSPKDWQRLCLEAGLTVMHTEVQVFKQPDLEWYFTTAATVEANRQHVYQLITTASPHVREVYRLAEEAGKCVWWWPRLLLVAQRK